MEPFIELDVFGVAVEVVGTVDVEAAEDVVDDKGVDGTEVDTAVESNVLGQVRKVQEERRGSRSSRSRKRGTTAEFAISFSLSLLMSAKSLSASQLALLRVLLCFARRIILHRLVS